MSGWAITSTIFTLSFLVGPVVKKPGVVDDQVTVRAYLHLTVLFDHDVIDGAPAARFMADLNKLIESAHSLHDL